ncbi:MAG: PLP-dependent aspartate aminotransferase family protein [Eubacteriales bacterium]
MKDDTILTHGYRGPDPITGAISFPIFQSATFRHNGLNQSTGYDYTRAGNPTREELEKTMALMEQGEKCWAFASGMAAISTVFRLLKPGQHVLLSEDLYGGTHRLAEEIYKPYGIDFEFADTSDIGHLTALIRTNTSMIFVETPSNPMMRVTDLAKVHEAIAQRDILLVVDNTFLTPYLQKPLCLGADIVVHSGTKYLCGHNDVLAGFVIAGKRDGLAEQLSRISMSEGAILGAFDSWLMIRSLKTLSVRLERQEKNAMEIARFLSGRPEVTDVFYVGLPDHPGYDTNTKQARGAGAMISFRLSSRELTEHILGNLHLIFFAESLGGVESLITYPIVQTHAETPDILKDRVGIDDCLLRLSVGIEDVTDLIEDLTQAISSNNNPDKGEI